MKRVAIVVLAVAILGAVGWEVRRRIAESSKKEDLKGRKLAVAVETAPVKRATVREIGAFTGSIIPRSQFVVAPKVSGRLKKLTIDIGDKLAAGQELALLDDEEYALQVAQAKAELAVAKTRVDAARADLTVAKREYERYGALRLKDVATESELDLSKATYDAKEALCRVAEAQVAQSEAALKASEVRLSYTRIPATWEGGGAERLVGERFADEGTQLAPNTPVVSIVDISSVIAVIYVTERDYPRITIGKTVSISTDAWPRREFEGKVARIAPVLKESSRQARIEVDIRNADYALKPGMFVRAGILFQEHADATVVPMAALAKREGGRGVFQVDAATNTVKFVPVEVGIIEGDLAEVKAEGLVGPVVTLGQHLLSDGTGITISQSRREAAGGGKE